MKAGKKKPVKRSVGGKCGPKKGRGGFRAAPAGPGFTRVSTPPAGWARVKPLPQKTADALFEASQTIGELLALIEAIHGCGRGGAAALLRQISAIEDAMDFAERVEWEEWYERP